jgi:hypothetical protein
MSTFQCSICGTYYGTSRGLSYHQNRSACVSGYVDSLPAMKRLRAAASSATTISRSGLNPSTQQLPAQPITESNQQATQEEEDVDFDFAGNFDDFEDDITSHDPTPQPGGPTIRQASSHMNRDRQIDYERPWVPPPLEERHPVENHQDNLQVNHQDKQLPPPTLEDLCVQNKHLPASTGRDSIVSIPMIGKIVSVSPCDQSMARFYKLCDDTGAPKFLCDKILAMLQEEMMFNSFNPSTVGISKRRTYFARMQKQLAIPPPESIPVKLESGEEVIVYRFDFQERLQRHLISDVYADLSNLSLPNQLDPWSSIPSDNAVDYSSATRSQWYQNTCTMYKDLLDTGTYMME